MAKEEYPIIAVLTLETNELKKRVIKFRVRKVVEIKYVCPVCKSGQSLKRYMDYLYARENVARGNLNPKIDYSGKYTPEQKEFIEFWHSYYDEKRKTKIYTNFYDKAKDEIMCADCFLKKKLKNYTKKETKFLYQIYTTSQGHFVNMEMICMRYMPFRFKKKLMGAGGIKCEYWSINNLESAYNSFDSWIKDMEQYRNDKKPNFWRKRGTKWELKVIKGITEEQLDRDYKKYMMRKVARAI